MQIPIYIVMLYVAFIYTLCILNSGSSISLIFICNCTRQREDESQTFELVKIDVTRYAGLNVVKRWRYYG